MKTIVVWVLLAYNSASNGRIMTVVDNIASQQNCQALANVMTEFPGYSISTRCVAVRKVAT